LVERQPSQVVKWIADLFPLFAGVFNRRNSGVVFAADMAVKARRHRRLLFGAGLGSISARAAVSTGADSTKRFRAYPASKI
jgi:hypothetical protein